MLDTERLEGCSSLACQATPFEKYSTRLVPYGGKVSHRQGGIVGAGCQRFFQSNVICASLHTHRFRLFPTVFEKERTARTYLSCRALDSAKEAVHRQWNIVPSSGMIDVGQSCRTSHASCSSVQGVLHDHIHHYSGQYHSTFGH